MSPPGSVASSANASVGFAQFGLSKALAAPTAAIQSLTEQMVSGAQEKQLVSARVALKLSTFETSA